MKTEGGRGDSTEERSLEGTYRDNMEEMRVRKYEEREEKAMENGK